MTIEDKIPEEYKKFYKRGYGICKNKIKYNYYESSGYAIVIPEDKCKDCEGKDKNKECYK